MYVHYVYAEFNITSVDNSLVHGSQIMSEIRQTDISPKAYMKRYWNYSLE